MLKISLLETDEEKEYAGSAVEEFRGISLREVLLPCKLLFAVASIIGWYGYSESGCYKDIATYSNSFL